MKHSPVLGSRLASGRDYHRQFLDRFLPSAGVIGDIGCGDSRIAAFYQNEQRQFVCVDTEPAYPWIIRGDARDLPIADHSLDAFIGLGIFELAGPPAVAEARRALKPGGLLYATVPYRNLPRRIGLTAKWRGIAVPSFTPSTVANLLDGFEIIFIRQSSISWGLGPLRRLGSIFPRTLEAETGVGYMLLGWALRPFANSLLVVARAT